MNIDFLIADNPYQSTLHFSKKFGEALQRKGVQVRWFDISEGRFYQAFYQILKAPPDFTASFSDIRIGEGLPLGDQWQIPHISFFIDPAIYFLHQLKGRFSFVTSIDQEDTAFIKQSMPRVCFLPHAVEKELRDLDQKRIYDVVLLGTCVDIENVRAQWKETFSPSIIRILEEAAERVLSPEGISSLRALIEAGVEKDLVRLHHELDLYIGGKDRMDLVNSLESMDLHIWGEGPWEKVAPKAIFHGPVSFQESLEVMQRAKLLLNSSPRFKNGSHERLFYGLASGALVVTGNNSFIKGSFTDEKDILTYEYGSCKESVPKIAKMLANDDERQACVERGKRIVAASHTWENRAETLLTWLSDYRKDIEDTERLDGS